MLSMDQAQDVIGASAYTEDGERIGWIGQLYLDDDTEQPEWITVSTGFFETGESFVPLAEARLEGDRVLLPYSKDQVKGAPRVEVDDGHLSADEEAELYRYYGLPESGPFSGLTGTSGPVEQASATPVPGAGDDRPAETATPTEEQLRTGAEERRTGRSRLRRFTAGDDDEPIS